MLSEMLLFLENEEYIRTIFPLDLLANVSYLWKWKTLWIEISWHKLAMWKAWIRQLCTMCTKFTTYTHRADNIEGSLSCKCKIQCNFFAVKYLICSSSYSNHYELLAVLLVMRKLPFYILRTLNVRIGNLRINAISFPHLLCGHILIKYKPA